MHSFFLRCVCFFAIILGLGTNVFASVFKASYPMADSAKVTETSYQTIIDTSVALSFREKSIAPLETAMAQVKADTEMLDNYKTYWQVYLLRNRFIIQLYFLKENKKAEKTIEQAIELLEDKAENSEDYALLASCKLFSIQFLPVMEIPKISKNVQQNLENALSANPKNFRAYYVLAENNLYTPPMFGGMEKVEAYAEKAFACPMVTDTSKYAPVWGKADLYRVLIQYYSAKKDEAKKQKYETLLQKEFPYLS